MIGLPSLGAVPSTVSTGPSDRLAAQCALALASPGPIPRVRARGAPVEIALLKLELEAHLFAAARQMNTFRPRVHATLGATPVMCNCCEGSVSPITVWLGNGSGEPMDARWHLEARWKAIERAAPGLAETALEILRQSSDLGVPLYTPPLAMGFAQWTYWWGEIDERHVIAEVRGQEGDEPERPADEKLISDDEFCEMHNIISRARIDRALPPFVTSPKRRLKLPELERLANGRGACHDLAASTLALAHAVAGAERGKPRYALHTQADEIWSLGWGAVLRWNGRDPMYRILDDHANHIMESSEGLEEAWGWFVVKSPGQLRGFFAHLEERFAIGRLQERVIEALAQRARQ